MLIICFCRDYTFTDYEGKLIEVKGEKFIGVLDKNHEGNYPYFSGACFETLDDKTEYAGEVFLNEDEFKERVEYWTIL